MIGPTSITRLATLALAGLVLTGCAGQAESPAAEPAPVATVTATVTADPTPTPDPAAQASASAAVAAKQRRAKAARAQRLAQQKAAATRRAHARAVASRKAAAQRAEERRKPVLDSAAMSACAVLASSGPDVTTKQDRSDFARAFNVGARQSAEQKVRDAGGMLTDEVGSWTGFMWDGAMSNAADVCIKGDYNQKRNQ